MRPMNRTGDILRRHRARHGASSDAAPDGDTRISDAQKPFVSLGKRRMPWWLAILAAGIACIVLGASDGAAVDLWRRASLICYECIGIG